MMLAATQAGIAFSNASVALVHGTTNTLAAATGVENLAYGTTHLEFHFYPNCSDLLSGIATETFDAPM